MLVMPEIVSFLAGATSLIALLVAAAAWRAAQSSSPAQLVRQMQLLADRVAEFADRDEGRDSKLLAWRADMEAVLEQVENLVETTERKRRQTAAAASKLDRDSGATNGATDYEGVVSKFRSMGMDV